MTRSLLVFIVGGLASSAVPVRAQVGAAQQMALVTIQRVMLQPDTGILYRQWYLRAMREHHGPLEHGQRGECAPQQPHGGLEHRQRLCRPLLQHDG